VRHQQAPSAGGVGGTLRRPGAVAALGSVAALCAWAPIGPASALAAPGQSIYNDYGQSQAEVNAELTNQVTAYSSVKAARAKVLAAHAVVARRLAIQSAAQAAYHRALATHNAHTIAVVKARYAAAIKATTAAKRAESAAYTAYTKTLATVRAAFVKLHYRPVDGTYASALQQYFIPGNGLEPITVNITVYGGHVSDVTASGYVTTGDSGSINARAVPILSLSAMQANDTAVITTVSGASVTSGAFKNGLVSALTKAGFHA
jgi:hypothetical protein